VETLAIRYDELRDLLAESDVTFEALHQAADRHEEENIEWRSRDEQAPRDPATSSGAGEQRDPEGSSARDDHAEPSARQA
jgi:hypothetical protein